MLDYVGIAKYLDKQFHTYFSLSAPPVNGTCEKYNLLFHPTAISMFAVIIPRIH